MKYLIFILLLLIFLSLSSVTRDTCNKSDIIKKLTRQTARWAVAAQQDKSPLIRNLHMGYSMGYWWALKDIFSNNEIEQVTKLNVEQFEKKILELQDNITRGLVKACPQFAGDIDQYLGQVAGDI